MHDLPVDMTVSRQNVDVNTTESNVDNTDPKSSGISSQHVCTSQEINSEISDDIPDSQVNIERGEKQHPDALIDKDNDSKKLLTVCLTHKLKFLVKTRMTSC